MELFPFLAVLACMLGTLILVVIIVSSSVLGTRRAITLVARDAQGRNLELKPNYVEVRGDGVLLHPTQEFVPRSDIRRASTPLGQLLRRVADARDREYIIVAVRPDGFETFALVRSQVEGLRIQIGYEPIDEEWTVRFRQ